MRKMNFRSRLRLLIILSLMLFSLIGFAVGKYIKTIPLTGQVTFTARLAEDVILQEHLAVRQTNGGYSLHASDVVTSNSYKLIPGLDVPKDPHIIIKGKTPIPAYLFIEVESTLDTPVVYQIDDANWTLLEEDSTKKVYQYKDEITASFSETAINILKDKQITVSQHLVHQSDEDQDVLTIRALLIEKVEDRSAADTYSESN